MIQPTSPQPYDRIMGWVLPAIVAVTPFVVVYVLLQPHIGQSFFFQIASLTALGSLGLAWLAGWSSVPRRVSPIAWLFLFNIVAMGLSLLASRSPIFSLRQLLLPLSAVGFFTLLVLHPRRAEVLHRINLVLMAVGGLLAAYGIAQHFGYELLLYSEELQKNKVIATIGHPNYLASVLGPITFITLGFIYGRRSILGTLWGGGLIFMLLLCIILAETRAVWLGVVVGLISVIVMGSRYLIQHRRNRQQVQRLALGMVLIVVGLVVAIVYLLPQLNASINIGERLRSDKEIKSRLFYWNTAIDLGFKKPVIGTGYAQFDPLFWDQALDQQKSKMGPYYFDFIPAISGSSPGHVHNEFLEFFCEQGFTGLIALAALIGFFLYFGYLGIMRQTDPSKAFMHLCFYGALVMILVDAMFSFPWRLPVSLMIFMVVLAWMVETIYPQVDPQQALTEAP